MVLADKVVFANADKGLFRFIAEGATLSQFVNNYYAGLSIDKDVVLPDGVELVGVSIVGYDANNNKTVDISNGDTAIVRLMEYGNVNKLIFGVECKSIRIKEDWDAVTERINQHTQVSVSPMYFSVESLGLWITPQQQMQFISMYPLCFDDAYRTAVGKLTAQVGNILDMPTILAETDENLKDNTIRWVLQVLTAAFVCSATLNMSEPLERAEKEVTSIIAQLKGGQVSLQEPYAHRDDEYNAEAEVFSIKNQYRG